MSILEGIRESFRLPDLRRRILITLLLLVIYRLAANVAAPGVDRGVLEQVLDPSTATGQLGNVLNLLSGGAISNFSVLAMGVYPYITASIVVQILTPLIPALEQLAKEGQAGRDRINRYTYYLAVPLAMFQAFSQINIFGVIPGFGFGPEHDILLTITVLFVMTAGTMFAIWLGELISEDGIGNGISLIIFAGIISQIPFNITQYVIVRGADVINAPDSIRNVLLWLFITIVTVVVIVIVQEGTRRIPVKYGKRVRGTKMYGGGSTYLPLKVNQAGMIPLIFAQSILVAPSILAGLVTNSPTLWLANFANSVVTFFSGGGTQTGVQAIYWLLYFGIVVGITYGYTDIIMRNQNWADNLQRNGGFIPGIRPGKRTEDFISKVMRRITLVGALFLGIIAVLPGIIQIVMNLISPGEGSEVRTALQVMSGGGLVIIVGVVLDTLRVLEAQLVMRHRDTFIR